MRIARSASIAFGAGLLVLGLLFDAPAQTKKKPSPVKPTFENAVLPVVRKFCVTCHGKENPAAGINLSRYTSAAAALKDREVWDKVAQNVGSNHMPPKGSPVPTPAQRKALTTWIASSMTADCAVADPGRVTLRRLNRAEYDNTIHDLLGIDFKASEDFPSDDVGYGFDNVGDVLTMSPLLMEKYLRAAEQIAAKVIVTSEKKTIAVDPDHAELAGGGRVGEAGEFMFFTAGRVTQNLNVPRGGQYLLRVRAYGQQAGPDACQMKIFAAGKTVGDVAVSQTQGHSGSFEVPLQLDGKPVRVGASFENDYYHPEDPDPRRRDRNLIIESIELVGPLDSGALPEAHRRFVVSQPTNDDWSASVRACFTPFVTRAFRRPATTDEIGRLVELVLRGKKQGLSYEESLRIGMQAVLVSPSFLFRVEETKNGLLDSYQIATRLSYFLWSSMPDAALMDLAAKKALLKPDVVAQQAIRMLKSPKARALGDNFAGQWLQLRKLDIVTPDRKLYPTFDDDLRQAMKTETALYFENILAEDRSLLEFLDSNYSYLNDRLARHYGIAGVSGNEFRKVALEDRRRGGLVTQASILTVTSNPTRTSPVKRGKWVLENILGTPPPPPPPGAGDLPTSEAASPKTVRERLELHRRNPECAACHARLDPIGFGLENFDPIGGWRTEDSGQPIDSAGALPDGTAFNGPQSLRAYLLVKKDLFVHALAEKLLTYALGRGLDSADKCFVDEIARTCRAKGYRFSGLIEGIVKCKPFSRQGKGS